MENQTSLNTLLSQKLIQTRPRSSTLWRLKEVRKSQKKSLKLAEIYSWGFKKETLYNKKKV
jgi:hypothetical protein